MNINSWAGNYLQDWACLPRESGQAKFTISSNGTNGITITDEDPPGSGQIKTYSASVVGASPRTVRGFFIAGPTGNQYREDLYLDAGRQRQLFGRCRFTHVPGRRQSIGRMCRFGAACSLNGTLDGQHNNALRIMYIMSTSINKPRPDRFARTTAIELAALLAANHHMRGQWRACVPDAFIAKGLEG